MRREPIPTKSLLISTLILWNIHAHTSIGERGGEVGEREKYILVHTEYNYYVIYDILGWGDGSVCKMTATQASEYELGSPKLLKY